MEIKVVETPTLTPRKWKRVAYGGMQQGFEDNNTDESFLEEMVMNANVVKRGMLKLILDSVCISQYLCIVPLVILVWTYTVGSTLNDFLFLLDSILLLSGFLILLLTAKMISFSLFLNYAIKISFFIAGLYVLSPIYHTLTRSISSDSIWALTTSLIVLHLFLHNYSNSTVKDYPGALENPTFTSNISLNASIVASLLISSRLPSRPLNFAIVLFSLLVFLFAPLLTYYIKMYSFGLHLFFLLL